MRLRLASSAILAIASGLLCWFLLDHFHQGAADFQWSIKAARHLLGRTNPYDTPFQQYPMTAALFGVPFVWMDPTKAAATFFGLSSGLLAFGLTRSSFHRLLIFFAYPYWAAMITAQWSPLLMVAAFFPLALPVTLAKPQVGFPIAATHLTRKGVIASLLFLLLTFVVMPSWLKFWLPQLQAYHHFFPVLIFPGPLLVLSLLDYRDRDAQFLFLSSIVPQRWFYDAFILWLIPKSRREVVYTVGLSWVVGVMRWYRGPHNMEEVGRWTVVFMFMPMLAVVLLRIHRRRSAKRSPEPGS